MGPGAVVKVFGGRFFSLTLFGFTQVLMDIEPLVRMIRGDLIVHGFTHTYLGALLVGALAILLGKPSCEFLLKSWNASSRSGVLSHLVAEEKISWSSAGVSAFIGSFSHVLFDSVMHSDMSPFAPFLEGNGLLHYISLEALHLFCFASGALGAIALICIFIWKKFTHET